MPHLEKVTLSVQDHVNFLSGEMCLPAPQQVHVFRVLLYLEQTEFQTASVSGDKGGKVSCVLLLEMRFSAKIVLL